MTDAAQLALDDTLEVFYRSTVLRNLQAVPVAEAQELLDALDASQQARLLDNATSYALDVIGRIVGVYPRPLVDAGNVTYWGFDSDLGGLDSSPVFVENAPEHGLVPVNTVDYKAAIRTKIIKNHTRYGSAPELMYYGQFAFGVPVSVRAVGLGDVEVTLQTGTPVSVVNAILSDTSNELADHIFVMPLPSTSRIVAVSFRYPNAFGFDLETGGFDSGYMGVSYVVNS